MKNSPEPILTLADLVDWSFPGSALAVVGQPIAHSLSPAMHNAALAELGRFRPEFRDWHYHKFEISPDELPRALELFHQKKFRGLNLTVPHKELAVEHLAARDGFVRAAGAANTLTAIDAGWHGANTDGAGLSAALQQDHGVELAGATVFLLGAGGAARAAAIECLRQRCTALWIGNRSRDRLQSLLASLQALETTTTLRHFVLGEPPHDLPAAAVVINATSLGLAPDDPAPLDLSRIPRPAFVYDMIYRPEPTALLRQATGLEIPRADGLSLLVQQGARSLESWTGTSAPVPVMQAAARAALAAN